MIDIAICTPTEDEFNTVLAYIKSLGHEALGIYPGMWATLRDSCCIQVEGKSWGTIEWYKGKDFSVAPFHTYKVHCQPPVTEKAHHANRFATGIDIELSPYGAANTGFVAGWDAAIQWAIDNVQCDDGYYADQIQASVEAGLTIVHKELAPGELPF